MADLPPVSNTHEVDTSAAPDPLNLRESVEVDNGASQEQISGDSAETQDFQQSGSPQPANPQPTIPQPPKEDSPKQHDNIDTGTHPDLEGPHPHARTPAAAIAEVTQAPPTNVATKAKKSANGSDNSQNPLNSSAEEPEKNPSPLRPSIEKIDEGPSGADKSAVSTSDPTSSGVGNNLPSSSLTVNNAPVDDNTNWKEEMTSAAKFGSAKEVMRCVGHVDTLEPLQGGEIALFLAARYNNINAVETLLEQFEQNHLDINIQDDDGWTPLYGAASGNFAMASMILRYPGVDVKIKACNGEIPLNRACYWGEADTVRVILAAV